MYHWPTWRFGNESSSRMQTIITPSSYYPAECSVCGKNGLTATFAIMLQQWQSEMVNDRDAIIRQINGGSMTLKQMANIDAEIPGFSAQAWRKAGIVSDCCKMEILSHIPFDVFQRDYNDADRALPPDFDAKAIVSENVQTREVLQSPIMFETIGTSIQYSS